MRSGGLDERLIHTSSSLYIDYTINLLELCIWKHRNCEFPYSWYETIKCGEVWANYPKRTHFYCLEKRQWNSFYLEWNNNLLLYARHWNYSVR